VNVDERISKWGLKKQVRVAVEWIYLAQNIGQFKVPMKKVTKIQIL
jgi:hypothetical protein